MKMRQWFYIVLTVVGVWFLYTQRNILAPFVFAAIFAYIFNPVINFSSSKFHIPRTIGIFGIYSLILGIFVVVLALLTSTISRESLDLSKILLTTIDTARGQVYLLPDWLRPVTRDVLITLRHSRFIGLIGNTSFSTSFTQAISRVISFFIFLFSGYYFLKDGEKVIHQAVSYLPGEHKKDIEQLLKQVSAVLGGYLRGQLILVGIVSTALYIALTILGIKFALTLAIFSGFAEIVPVIGPITAGAVAVLVELMTGTINFGFSPLQGALGIILVYFVFRQLEDYLVIPHIMERLTKLPAFLIFFSVVAGGHIAGIVGLVLAVPIAGVLKVLLEYSFKKLHSS